MKKPAYDVIVVGAGPTGSTAARRAAEAGLDTLLIEKRQEIGAPVRCGEAIGIETLRPYLDPDPYWINAEINCYTVHNSLNHFVRLPPTEPTLIVDRKIFDRELARLAAEAGAEVQVGASAIGVLRENGMVSGLRIRSSGREHRVVAKLVIAADGTESQLARWAGLKTVPALADYYVGFQFLLRGLGAMVRPDECQYHLDLDIAPGGYVWVFPKGHDTANVGLVITGNHADSESARSRLERFVAKYFPHASVLSIVMGGIPVTSGVKQMVTDGLMAAGDAAHQADPMMGGGIQLGMMGGEMAIQVGAQAIRDGDVSADGLREYETKWQQRFGQERSALYQMRRTISKLDQKTINSLVEDAANLPLETMSLGQIGARLFVKHPRLLVEVAKLALTGAILK